MCLSHEVFQELRVDSHRSIFTSVEVFPHLLRTIVRSSSRTVAFSCSAPAEPCHLLHQVSLFLRCLYGYGLMIRPFARPFLDRCTNSPSFNSSSDLRIFKLDGVPFRCDMPNNLASSSLSSSEFTKLLFLLLRRRNMPSLPSYGTGPSAIIPSLISSDRGIVFWSLFSHSSNLLLTWYLFSIRSY